jgi:small subunit ribosomal protein S21
MRRPRRVTDCRSAERAHRRGEDVARIFVRDDESLEAGIKRFKRMRDKEGTVRDFKKKQYYVKPSDDRRERLKKAIRRLNRKKARSSSRRTRK